MKVIKTNGEVVEVASEDGGGRFLGEGQSYEVHFTDYSGEPICIYQKDIEKVLDDFDTEVAFGNIFYEDHPQYDASKSFEELGKYYNGGGDIT